MMKYNDNELLYLLSETDEVAFEFIIKKYEPLIKSRLIAFKINTKNYEDFFQECLIVLNKCIYNYREDRIIPFNSYFDKMIQYRIRYILEEEKEYYYNVISVQEYELDTLYKDCKTENDKEFSIALSRLEEDVYDLLKEGKSIEVMVLSLGQSHKTIYNAIARLKKKISNDRLFKDKTLEHKLSEHSDLMYNDSNHNILSSLEYDVYAKYIQGYRASEISYMLRIEVKTVYCALKRIKRKLKL